MLFILGITLLHNALYQIYHSFPHSEVRIQVHYRLELAFDFQQNLFIS